MEETMMNDFIFHNPDKVYFGKNQLEHLSEELLNFGKKVLHGLWRRINQEERAL